MDHKWKMNGDELVIHNKKTGVISIINGSKINEFHQQIDECVKDFLG